MNKLDGFVEELEGILPYSSMLNTIQGASDDTLKRSLMKRMDKSLLISLALLYKHGEGVHSYSLEISQYVDGYLKEKGIDGKGGDQDILQQYLESSIAGLTTTLRYEEIKYLIDEYLNKG